VAAASEPQRHGQSAARVARLTATHHRVAPAGGLEDYVPAAWALLGLRRATQRCHEHLSLTFWGADPRLLLLLLLPIITTWGQQPF
jgi:hypothetical protein